MPEEKIIKDPAIGIPRVPGTYGKVAILTEKSLDALVSGDYSHKSVHALNEQQDEENKDNSVKPLKVDKVVTQSSVASESSLMRCVFKIE